MKINKRTKSLKEGKGRIGKRGPCLTDNINEKLWRKSGIRNPKLGKGRGK